MAKLLEYRTDNDVKNKWYSMQRKEKRFQEQLLLEIESSSRTSRSGESTKHIQPHLAPHHPNSNNKYLDMKQASTVRDVTDSKNRSRINLNPKCTPIIPRADKKIQRTNFGPSPLLKESELITKPILHTPAYHPSDERIDGGTFEAKEFVEV